MVFLARGYKSEFHKNKINADGMQSYCIDCQKEVYNNAKKNKTLKKSREQIKDKISMNKKGIYISTYDLLIKPDEIDKVLKAVQKVEYDYVPTTDSIIKETGIKKFKVRAVLLYLIGMNHVKKAYAGKRGTVKYKVV